MAWVDVTSPTYWTSTNSATPGQIGDDYIWDGAKWRVNTIFFVNHSGTTRLVPTGAAIAMASTATGLRITFEAAETITSLSPFACGYLITPPPDGANPFSDVLGAANGDPAGTPYGPVVMGSYHVLTTSGNYSEVGAGGFYYGVTFNEFNIVKIELETAAVSSFWTDFIGCTET